VFAVKWAGSLAMMGAGMCLGVEAPMVHLGSCIASMAANANQSEALLKSVSSDPQPAAVMTLPVQDSAPAGLWACLSRQRWVQRLVAGRGVRLPEDEASLALVVGPYNRNVHRREMISAGAAAGIAAAFGAPIGGVLFSLEEACSVWNRRVAQGCFICCVVAVFTHSQLNPHALSGLLSVSLHPLTPWQWLQQLPALVAVSIGGGLLGAAFNKLRTLLRPLRAKPKRHLPRTLEAVAVAALTASAAAVLSATVGR
jgi:chloride channel 7